MPSDDPLLDAYRLIRRVEASAESPWPGMLAHSETGGTVLLVDVEELGAEWPGWLARADGHLLAPIDLVRRSNGHDAVIPPCAERLADFLRRRADAVLGDGERLTIVVSLLRGLVETVELPDALDTRGEWWLSDGGRPVFALSPAPRSVAAETESMLRDVEIGAGDHLVPVLAEVIETIRDPSRLVRNAVRLEQALFAAATAEPLVTTVLAPRRARSAAPREDASEELVEDRAGIVTRLARHVDADLADAFSRATTAIWRRFHTAQTPARRRRPMLVAALSAAVVVTGGLLWPVGGAATAQPDQGAPSASATDAAAEAGAADPESTGAASHAEPGGVDAGSESTEPAAVDAAAPESLPVALDTLLSGRASCEGDAGCLAAFLEDPLASLPAGAIDLASDQRSIAFVDDFGGAAVLEVAPVADEGTVQLVVIVRRDDEWLIRDVMDVPDQPR